MAKPNVAAIFDLINKAQTSQSLQELSFLLVNLSKQLVVYEQAFLYQEGKGFIAISGLSEVDHNSPMLIWFKEFIRELHQEGITEHIPRKARGLRYIKDLDQWFANELTLIPLNHQDPEHFISLVLVNDEPLSTEEMKVMDFWAKSWFQAFQILELKSNHNKHDMILNLLTALRERAPKKVSDLYRKLSHSTKTWFEGGYKNLFKGSFYKERYSTFARRLREDQKFKWKMTALLVCLFPVRLTIIAPGEIVASQPLIVRAPIEGVIEKFYIEPNSLIKKGQDLFSYDNAQLFSKTESAKQSYMSAQAEYRETSLLSLTDAKQKINLATLDAKVQQKAYEYQYFLNQMQRSVIQSPTDGWAIFDDPSEFVGKPVTVGEKVMMIADPEDVEIQAWIALSDMIAMTQGMSVTIYPNPNPFSSINGRIRYVTYEPVQLPDGQYAYRLRATINHDEKKPRLGLKGSVKVSGHLVPLCYWVLRKPLALGRHFIGI